MIGAQFSQEKHMVVEMKAIFTPKETPAWDLEQGDKGGSSECCCIRPSEQESNANALHAILSLHLLPQPPLESLETSGEDIFMEKDTSEPISQASPPTTHVNHDRIPLLLQEHRSSLFLKEVGIHLRFFQDTLLGC